MSFAGKVCVITGGTSGIGASTAELLARHGGSVVVCGRDRGRGESFVEQLRSQGLEVVYEQADCSVESAVDGLFDAVEARFGRVDHVFSNAGFEHAESHADTTKAIWDHIIANDLTSTFLVLRRSIAPLKATGGGSIVVMSSMVASIAFGFAAAFIPAQGAKEAMVRNLAAELGPHGVRVNAIAPGSTRTPSLIRFYEKWYPGGVAAGEEWSNLRHPLGRIAEPTETAEAIVFLLSDEASFVTGHTLRVDGGFCAQ